MKISRLNIVLVLGLCAIAGILVMQILWTKQAFNVEEKKFTQQVHIGLQRTLERLYALDNKEFPLKSPIKKMSHDYYVVNVNNDFDASLLEYCLVTEFEKAGVLTDFEYAIYKCESDEMVYGNYISFNDKVRRPSSVQFPKHQGLVYYFAIRFPGEFTYLMASLRIWLIMSGILIMILVIYLYSLFTIFQQKKYNELQRDFINNMTHEFKTPLSSILIASNYLNKQPEVRSNGKLEKYSSIIIDQSIKLNNHIEKILNIARWDNTPLTLEPTPIALRALLQTITDNLRLKHETLGVIINIPDDLRISADEFHFSNVVYNILDNAVKYCDGKPEVIIGLKEDGNFLSLSFSDNGIGVSHKDLGFIFDKFYRVPRSKANAVNGFGLGLYYVKKICVLHKWKIDVVNNLRSGITVSLLIPR